MSYLAAAESIARGVGPEVPIAEWSQPESHSRLRHFPPLFPVLLALPVSFHVSAAHAARWLEALAAGALALLVAWIAVSCVDRSRARTAALVTGLGALLAPAISLTFFMVLSEPLFLMFWALTLLLMLRAPDATLALGCCAACCALTRYVGVSVVAAVALWMLCQGGTLRVRCMRALLAAAPAFVGLAVWRAWSGGEFRRYAWYLDGLAASAEETWETLRQALAPIPEMTAVRPWQVTACASIVGLTGLLLMAAARYDGAKLPATGPDHNDLRFYALWRAASLMTGSYLSVLVVSRLRADPDIPFDWRILSPVILSWQLTLSIAVVRHWDRLRSSTVRLCAALVGLCWLGAASWNALHNVVVMHREGALYEAPEWQDSAFARWLRSSGRSYALYSNNPPVLWHLDHRSSWLLPQAADAATRAVLLERLRERPSALLGFRDALIATADPDALAIQLELSSRQCFEHVCVWTTAVGSAFTSAREPKRCGSLQCCCDPFQ